MPTQYIHGRHCHVYNVMKEYEAKLKQMNLSHTKYQYLWHKKRRTLG
jgi:hypothetical protein